MQGTIADSAARPLYIQVCVRNDVRLASRDAGFVHRENDVITTSRCSSGTERPLCREHARRNSGSAEGGVPVPSKGLLLRFLIHSIFIFVWMLTAFAPLVSEAWIGDNF